MKDIWHERFAACLKDENLSRLNLTCGSIQHQKNPVMNIWTYSGLQGMTCLL